MPEYLMMLYLNYIPALCKTRVTLLHTSVVVDGQWSMDKRDFTREGIAIGVSGWKQNKKNIGQAGMLTASISDVIGGLQHVTIYWQYNYKCIMLWNVCKWRVIKECACD